MLAGPTGFFGLLVGLLFGTCTAATRFIYSFALLLYFLLRQNNSTTEWPT